MEYSGREEEKARIGDFEIPVQCIVMNLRKNSEISHFNYHYHDYIELLYGLDGDASVWHSGRSYTLKSGDLVVINSREPHTVTSNQGQSSYIVIKFMPQILYAAEQSVFEFKYIIPFIVDDDRYDKIFLKSEIENSDIPEIMKEIILEWEKKEYGYEVALRIYVIKIVLWLIRRWHAENEENNSDAADESSYAIRSIQKSIEYARENFNTATTLEAAEKCNLSYSYFSRIFKKVMKKSFTEYVNHIRITEAQRLLIGTDKSITDIAFDIGFSTTSYFIECFKAQTSITPKQFRKNYRIETDTK